MSKIWKNVHIQINVFQFTFRFFFQKFVNVFEVRDKIVAFFHNKKIIESVNTTTQTKFNTG